MTRADQRLAKRCLVMVAVAFAIIYAVGSVQLWLRPANELDKRCLNKSIAEIGECMRDYYDGKAR